MDGNERHFDDCPYRSGNLPELEGDWRDEEDRPTSDEDQDSEDEDSEEDDSEDDDEIDGEVRYEPNRGLRRGLRGLLQEG